MRLTTRGIDFLIDDEFAYLAEICSFHCDGGYINTTCNFENYGIFSRFGYKQGQRVGLHRLLYQLHMDRKLGKEEFVDHKNCDKLDNKIENLRILSHSGNMKNKKLKKGQIYHNIYHDKYHNRFKFSHQEVGIQRSFRTLQQALEFFKQYDADNDHVLTKSIYNSEPIDQVEDIILEANAFCENCGQVYWSQDTLRKHQKKCD